MTRTIAALLAAATIAGVAAPAAAQTRYYAREHLVGLSTSASQPTVYTPVYSSSYGACINNQKSMPITSCNTSDGSTARLSDCSSFPQSTGATACNVLTCTMTPNTFIYNSDGTLPPQIDIPAATLDTARAKAKQICEANAGAIACLLTRTANPTAGVYVFTKPYKLVPGNTEGYYTGGVCAKN